MSDPFVDIRGAKIIGLDVETHDPSLNEKGPGGFRGDGELLGVGLATDDGYKHYYPIAHDDGQNYDRENVISYCNDMLKTDLPKVGANLTYDLEWLLVSGIRVKGPTRDIQIAEPLLDQERPGGYSLESLAQCYLGVGKDEQLLRVAAEVYGIKYKKEKEIKGHLKKFSPEYVGTYCAEDAYLPIEVYKKQIKLLKDEDLWDIFELESKLIPIFLQMKEHGVRVDTAGAEKLSVDLVKREELVAKEIKRLSGLEIDCWSNNSIASYFEQEGMKYSLTAKGNASFEGDFLTDHPDKVCQLIAEWRKVNTMRIRYVEDILKYEHNGRLHCCIHQLSADDEKTGAYGTRSGRLSYSHLNLQKIPKRDEEWRPIIRGLFLPEAGCFWGQQDYSQQEPRLGVHYAVLRDMPGSAEAAAYYREPGADFHTIVANMAGIERKYGKTLNLGSWYGMGKKKMMDKLKTSAKEAEEVYNRYHEALPFVKGLLTDCMRYADRRGYVKTILGRKAHFKDWQPRLDWDSKQRDWARYKPTRMEAIPDRVQKLKDQLELEKQEDLREQIKLDIERWESGRYERCGTYKALNRVIQGGAADQTKKAIVDTYEYFGHVRYIQIQVHDELDGSYDSMKDLAKVKEIMENTIQLKVPVVVENEIGESWGSVQPNRA